MSNLENIELDFELNDLFSNDIILSTLLSEKKDKDRENLEKCKTSLEKNIEMQNYLLKLKEKIKELKNDERLNTDEDYSKEEEKKMIWPDKPSFKQTYFYLEESDQFYGLIGGFSSQTKNLQWSMSEIIELNKLIKESYEKYKYEMENDKRSVLIGNSKKLKKTTLLEVEPSKKLIRDHIDKIDWKVISDQMKSRNAEECLIRYINYEDPYINKSNWEKGEENKLLKLAEKYKEHSWVEIAKELGTNRTPVDCLKHYQKFFNSKLLKGKWTDDEDEKLLNSVGSFGDQNWSAISRCLVGRTPVQCLYRYHKIKSQKKAGKWSTYENLYLIMGIKIYGPNWSLISKHIPLRTEIQCRERWENILNPKISRSKWTDEEDEKLLEYISKNKPPYSWSDVSQIIEGRTDYQCRRRYCKLTGTKFSS